MTGIDRAAERRQRPGLETEWIEAHRLDLTVSPPEQEPAAPLAVSLQLLLQPNRRRAGFLCAVLEVGQSPIVISELEIPLPATGWEVRTSGLWAEFVCEEPLDHWSYGLEAFALAIDDPNELLSRAIGDRVPIGWELEFEASDPAEWLDGETGYRQSGVGHGILLSKAGEREVEGTAVRTHWWGTRAPEPVGGRSEASTRPECQVVLPAFNERWVVALGSEGIHVTPTPAPGRAGREERY